MARTAITVSTSVRDVALAATATTLDPTNNHSVVADNFSKGHFLIFANTAGAAKNVTIKVGVNPPAIRQGIGDLVFSVPSSGSRVIRIETARYQQSDGTINIDLESGITGTVTAIVNS